MDWSALVLSLEIAGSTVLILVPVGMVFGRVLAWRSFPGKSLVLAASNLPLLLPPTVMGFYLLQALGRNTPLGRMAEQVLGHPLVFHFSGLVLASCLTNIPFAIQPVQRALMAIPREVLEAAACCGMGPWQRVWRVELPLAWPGLVSAVALVAAHCLGEFGVVLMMGGNIPGQTRTMSIAIYERIQAFDEAGAALLAATLLGMSLVVLAILFGVDRGRATRP